MDPPSRKAMAGPFVFFVIFHCEEAARTSCGSKRVPFNVTVEALGYGSK
jgi:hypothetical protein